ncbi:MAG: hypothetical protein KBH08_07330 [Brachymonas sp.]|nr:hypothetical protein [Brachymonas sp.]MBP9652253.1 hypothetical protein [Brachymonas sp.]
MASFMGVLRGACAWRAINTDDINGLFQEEPVDRYALFSVHFPVLFMEGCHLAENNASTRVRME